MHPPCSFILIFWRPHKICVRGSGLLAPLYDGYTALTLTNRRRFVAVEIVVVRSLVVFDVSSCKLIIFVDTNSAHCPVGLTRADNNEPSRS